LFGHAHVPAWQVAPTAHVFPQAPQLDTSFCVSWHVPLHTRPLFGHAHVPARQVAPEVQVFPQVPQFVALLCVSTHTPLHATPPFGHTHVPLWQLAPAGQVFPHAPQLFASVCLSTQFPPHRFAGSHAQAPFWQVKPVCEQVAPLSITPSQSLSRPSHCSAPLGVHWHMLG
jgi:hypothetical protein